ncbi:MAG: hypothetical protein K0U54_11360 [Bacteroidetes bacterium]|nr:hypothetical protein [Bacteroidota bacterium]
MMVFKKAFTLFLLIGFTTCNLIAQSLGELQVKALKDAKTTAQAMVDGDFAKILDYTHPAIIEKMGGKDVFLPQVEAALKMAKEQGVSFISSTADYASDVVKEQGEYRCYVQNTNIMTLGETKIKSTSYLLGFYLEDQEQWVFIEAEKTKNKPTMEMFLPGFETSLNIPADVMEQLE